MITYDEATTDIKVRLEGKVVGWITGSRSMGYWYRPKGGAPGEMFGTINEVKRSLEGDAETLIWTKIIQNGLDIKADTDYGEYTISVDSATAGGACYLWLPESHVDDFEEFKTIEEAKERALEDFSRRNNA